MDEPNVPFDRRLRALLDEARHIEHEGHATADRDSVELIEELTGRLTVFLDELRTARRRHLNDLHRGL